MVDLPLQRFAARTFAVYPSSAAYADSHRDNDDRIADIRVCKAQSVEFRLRSGLFAASRQCP